MIPSVAYTDPEVAWVGLTEDEAKARGINWQDHPPAPTLGESIGMAAEVAHGSCTDLPPARK